MLAAEFKKPKKHCVEGKRKGIISEKIFKILISQGKRKLSEKIQRRRTSKTALCC